MSGDNTNVSVTMEAWQSPGVGSVPLVVQVIIFKDLDSVLYSSLYLNSHFSLIELYNENETKDT